MVKVNIEELLKKKGKSKYWLCNQMNINYHNLNKIIFGSTKLISFKYIEVLCELLECSPSDLFTIEKSENCKEKN